MTRFCYWLPLAVALLLFPLTVRAAQTVEVTVVSTVDDLSLSRVRGYDLVELRADKSMLAGQPGTPWLPVRYVHILLPPGSRAAAVRAAVTGELSLDGTYTIHPAQPPVRLCDPGPHPFVEPDPAVYAATRGLRAEVATLDETVILRGYHLAVVRVNPLDYVPATGRLTLRTAITVTVELEDDPAVLAAFNAQAVRYRTAEPIFEQMVAADVLNPGDLVRLGYEPATPRSPVDPDDVAYLLIGSAATFDAFQPLLDWKTKKGVPAAAVDVNWIYANYAGADQQEKIKACIVDYVQNKGTVWVVLAGDNTIVPDRDCYGSVNDGDTTDTTIPTDLYYAGLDDMNWNDDGDGLAAEIGDDTIDMAPDVFVGRLPIRTAADATAIVNKTLQYERDLPATGFAEKMLLSGMCLWDWGDEEGKSEHMYADWIDPYWDPVRYRFYSSNTDFPGGASYDVLAGTMNEQLAAGYNFLHMATHGLPDAWAMEGMYDKYYSDDALGVVNPGRYTNIVTISCLTSAFEDSYDGGG